jgi:hypothetical protein
MNSPNSRKFAKRTTCPPANDVLLYLSEALSAPEKRRTLQHLRSCDFCGAEAELLVHHPLQTEEIAAPIMPEPLCLLAESMLTGGLSSVEDLADLNDEIGALGRA